MMEKAETTVTPASTTTTTQAVSSASASDWQQQQPAQHRHRQQRRRHIGRSGGGQAGGRRRVQGRGVRTRRRGDSQAGDKVRRKEMQKRQKSRDATGRATRAAQRLKRD